MNFNLGNGIHNTFLIKFVVITQNAMSESLIPHKEHIAVGMQ